MDLDRFEFVLLRRPKQIPDMPSDQVEELQTRHLVHLKAMKDSGQMLFAGPLDEQPDDSWRGLCVYHTGSLEATRRLAQSDPSVVAGRLEVDVMYFYCPKGQIPST